MEDKGKAPKATTKAVAVKQREQSPAPQITAKGEGFLAERILDIAFAEGVKVRQDSDLTELLSAFEVEAPVPLEALHAVSLILERVYEENKRMQNRGDTEMDPVSSNRNAPGEGNEDIQSP